MPVRCLVVCTPRTVFVCTAGPFLHAPFVCACPASDYPFAHQRKQPGGVYKEPKTFAVKKRKTAPAGGAAGGGARGGGGSSAAAPGALSKRTVRASTKNKVRCVYQPRAADGIGTVSRVRGLRFTLDLGLVLCWRGGVVSPLSRLSPQSCRVSLMALYWCCLVLEEEWTRPFRSSVPPFTSPPTCLFGSGFPHPYRTLTLEKNRRRKAWRFEKAKQRRARHS